jgi:PIN domain nuclease of toxin-antitoxin system
MQMSDSSLVWNGTEYAQGKNRNSNPVAALWQHSLTVIANLLKVQECVNWCRTLDSKPGFQIQPLLWEDVHEARVLPFDDPFDCLIAGTALCLGLPLITTDATISDSGLVETIW